MPSTSRAQHRTMEAALHDDKIRRKLGIPKDVAEDYVNADKRNSNWRKHDHAAKKAALLMSCALMDYLIG